MGPNLLDKMRSGARIGGIFNVICRDKDGNIKWQEEAHNLITNEGLDHILDVLLHGTTPVSPWYIGLKNTGSPAAGDTLASHAGWTENSNYAGDRKEFVEGAASSQSTDNVGNEASFAINADAQTIAGAFLCSVATTTTGILLCAADFASSKSCDDGDTLEVTYTISAADDGA